MYVDRHVELICARYVLFLTSPNYFQLTVSDYEKLAMIMNHTQKTNFIDLEF